MNKYLNKFTIDSLIDEFVFPLLICILGYIIIELVILKVAKKALIKSNIDEALHTFVLRIIKMIFILIIAVAVLTILGVPTTSLIAVLGSAGVAIALALKDSLSNFAGGILILLNKPFSKGDFIEDLEISGKVEKIDVLYSVLKTFDNKTIIIPNGKLANSTIINYTREEKRRADIQVSISYNSDMQLAKALLKQVADDCPMVIREQEYIIGVANHNGSAIDLDLKAWCLTEDYWDVLYELRENIKLKFDENNIIMPHSQMDVHLKKGD